MVLVSQITSKLDISFIHIHTDVCVYNELLAFLSEMLQIAKFYFNILVI